MAVPHPDGTCSTSWSIDLHYADPENSKNFPELVSLMEQGAGEQGLPNDQDFCIHGCFDPNISPK